MAARPILDLDDPDVRVEADFAPESLLDLGVRYWLIAEAARERPIRRSSIIESALRRWAEQLRRAIEPVQLDENGTGLLGAAVPHRGEGPFAMAAANVSRHPNRRFEAHGWPGSVSPTKLCRGAAFCANADPAIPAGGR